MADTAAPPRGRPPPSSVEGAGADVNHKNRKLCGGRRTGGRSGARSNSGKGGDGSSSRGGGGPVQLSLRAFFSQQGQQGSVASTQQVDAPCRVGCAAADAQTGVKGDALCQPLAQRQNDKTTMRRTEIRGGAGGAPTTDGGRLVAEDWREADLRAVDGGSEGMEGAEERPTDLQRPRPSSPATTTTMSAAKPPLPAAFASFAFGGALGGDGQASAAAARHLRSYRAKGASASGRANDRAVGRDGRPDNMSLGEENVDAKGRDGGLLLMTASLGEQVAGEEEGGMARVVGDGTRGLFMGEGLDAGERDGGDDSAGSARIIGGSSDKGGLVPALLAGLSEGEQEGGVAGCAASVGGPEELVVAAAPSRTERGSGGADAGEGEAPEGDDEDGRNQPAADSDCDIELERERRISRNRAIMAQLGISNMGAAKARAGANLPAKRRNAGQPTRGTAVDVAGCGEAGAQPQRSTRRASARLQNKAMSVSERATAEAPGDEPAAEAQAEEESAMQYIDSGVRKYACSDDSFVLSGILQANYTGGELTTYRMLPGTYCDDALTRAYGLDVSCGLLAAGGHRGHVSIWALQNFEAGADSGPLLSARLHDGWVCDVQLLLAGVDPSHDGALLLTASNDASVALWDVGRASSRSGLPPMLLESRDAHDGGIFSMQLRNHSVLTASKDSTVAVSRLFPEGKLQVEQRLSFHEGVVKCARWRDDNVIASCGNDRSICMHDLRVQPLDKPSVGVLANSHRGAVNQIQWSPEDPNMILSCGCDEALHVFDVRRAGSAALHTFSGHISRGSSIYQPLWTDGGRAIVTGGDGKTLSLYCCRTGGVRSRGELGFDPKATIIATPNTNCHMLLLATTKRIVACQPCA